MTNTQLSPRLLNCSYVIVDFKRPGELAKFWRPNRSGYTTNIAEAGAYTRAEAQDIVKGSHEICALPVDYLVVESVRVVDFVTARDLECPGRIDPEGGGA